MPDDINSVIPQVQPGVGVAGGATPDDYGAGLGRVAAGFASELAPIIRQEQHYADQEQVSKAHVELGGWVQDKLLHPQTGLLNQGFNDSAALQKAGEQTLSDFDEKASATVDALPNDRQKAMALHYVAEQRAMLQHQVYSYEKQQGDRLYATGGANEVKLAQQQAANFYDAKIYGPDHNPVADSLALQRAKITDMAAHLGWTPEQRDQAIEKATNDTHTAVLQSMLGRAAIGKEDALQAKAYYDAHEADLFPQQRELFGKSVEAAAIHQESASIANELMTDPKTGQPRSEGEAMSLFAQDPRIQKDENLGKATEALVSRKYSIQRQIQTQDENNTYKAAYNTIANAGWDVRAIPKDILESMSVEHQDHLREVALRNLHGDTVTTPQGNAYFINMRSALSGSMGEKAKQDALTEDIAVNGAHMLNMADLRSLSELQNQTKLGKDQSGIKDADRIAAETLFLNGKVIPKAEAGEISKVPEAIRFRMMLGEKITAQQQASGKEPIESDIRKMAASLMLPTDSGNDWRGESIKVPAYLIGYDPKQSETALDTKRIATSVQGFSDADVAATRAELRGAGFVDDNASVLQALRDRANAKARPTKEAAAKPTVPAKRQWWDVGSAISNALTGQPIGQAPGAQQ